jgi:hypothetical protein
VAARSPSSRSAAWRQRAIQVLGFLNDVEPAGSGISAIRSWGRLQHGATCRWSRNLSLPHKAKHMRAQMKSFEGSGAAGAVGNVIDRRRCWLTMRHTVLACLPRPGVRLSGARLGDHVTVRHGQVSHDCTVGNFVMIGVNAVSAATPRRDGAHMLGAWCASTTIGRFSVMGSVPW